MQSRWKDYIKKLGPGFITGASDDDPSGIATYSQTGAQFGYTQLWTALWSIPFMIVIQEMCGRIGMVTGTGLAGVIRKHYSGRLLFGAVLLLLVANTINIGADLGAMASSAALIIGLPFVVLLLTMTVVTLLLEVFVPYPTYAKFLKYLTLSLLAYVVTLFVVKEPWGTIGWNTIVPHVQMNKEYLMNIVALLGTTVSPYLFFWQADEEVEEEVESGKLKAMGVGTPKINSDDVRAMRQDTVIGMSLSNVITFFIIATAASAFGMNGINDISTADQAAKALEPLAGPFAEILFALGIIGTGLLAVPVLAGSAAYALSEAFTWKEGLYLKMKQAHGFYGIITVATLTGLLINFTHIPHFKMLYYSAVLNGILAPPLMVLILLIGNNKKIMGKYVNGKASNVFGWVITAVMGVCAVAMVVTLI
jgi:NRAMP (natural resistance-associated macrophage protein)-like metal ion transporter